MVLYKRVCVQQGLRSHPLRTLPVVCSAANCKAAGERITARFPHIWWQPCQAHCVDLLLEDIGRLPWVEAIIKRWREAVNFIRNHQWSLALVRSKSKMASGSHLELIAPGEDCN